MPKTSASSASVPSDIVKWHDDFRKFKSSYIARQKTMHIHYVHMELQSMYIEEDMEQNAVNESNKRE